MSEAMIQRPYTNLPAMPRREGFGDVVNDTIASALAPQIAAAKADVLAEVKKQGDEAKRTAIIGGIVAGLAGVGLGIVIAKKVL